MKDLYFIRWIDPVTLDEPDSEDAFTEWRMVGWVKEEGEMVIITHAIEGEDNGQLRTIIHPALIREKTPPGRK